MVLIQRERPMSELIDGMPKAELHLHIEGTFEPELMLEIAARNRIRIKHASAEELRAAYAFTSLQDFLDIYYEGARVLRTERDFYDLTFAYLAKAHAQNVLHAEIHFDPQTHTGRGVRFEVVIEGIHAALADGEKKLGTRSNLILCFLRHLDERAAFQALQAALPYKPWIAAVGLDSSERGNPPAKFASVFRQARQAGFLAVAHAGEEGPAAYVEEAVDVLGVSRIDHGNHALDDPKLVKKLAERRIPLTVCPLSNLKLKVVDDLAKHPIRRMLEQGLVATVNSDDPAYFGGYVNENYRAIADALSLTKKEICTLSANSFAASFLSESEKVSMTAKLKAYMEGHGQAQ